MRSMAAGCPPKSLCRLVEKWHSGAAIAARRQGTPERARSSTACRSLGHNSRIETLAGMGTAFAGMRLHSIPPDLAEAPQDSGSPMRWSSLRIGCIRLTRKTMGAGMRRCPATRRWCRIRFLLGVTARPGTSGCEMTDGPDRETTGWHGSGS